MPQPLLRTALLVMSLAWSRTSLGQDRGPAAARNVTIPFLANQNNPSDLDFMAAQCDVAPNGDEMSCRFRQVFLTVSAIDSKSCVITTSGYEQTFRRTAATRWTADGTPEGPCGSVETAVLEDGGGTRWTLTLRTTATRTDLPECRATPEHVDLYDSTHVKRPLPCSSVQPGAIER